MAKTKTMRKKTSVSSSKILEELEENYGVSISDSEEQFALQYIDNFYPEVVQEHKSGYVEGFNDMSSHDYALSTLANGLLDREHMDGVTDLGNGLSLQKPLSQEFIDVDQETLKEALRNLISSENSSIATIYEYWEQFNEEYFFGELSTPLITFEKMDNRTLGSYTSGKDEMGITNHIRFNRNFIALNPIERVLETLKHEMIHQWQDEILYIDPNVGKPRVIKYKKMTSDDELVVLEREQKERKSKWHNTDFKNMAKVVGIKAEGDTCYGNPANMPEVGSYNRKFICGCIASNGYPITIWSTRTINAVCQSCKQKYIEIPKGGKVIRISQSHIEKPGEDAVEKQEKHKYKYFKRFKTKEAKERFVESYAEKKGHNIKEIAEGNYQKNHNKFKDGFRHWIAFNVDAEELPKPVEKKKSSEAPKKVDVDKTAKKKDTSTKGKAKDAKPKKQEEPKKASSEEPKETEEMKVSELPGGGRSYKNAEDLLHLYKQLGSISAVANYFCKAPGTIVYQAKQLGVDFKEGVIKHDKG